MKEKKDFIVSNVPAFFTNRKPNSNDEKNKQTMLIKQNSNFAFNYRTLGMAEIPQSKSIRFRDSNLSRNSPSENQTKSKTIKKNFSSQYQEMPSEPQTPIFISPATSEKKLTKSIVRKQRIQYKLTKSRHTEKQNNKNKCFNHHNVKAIHQILIDGKIIPYCGQCAIQLRNQKLDLNQFKSPKQFYKIDAYHTNVFDDSRIQRVGWHQQMQNCLKNMSDIRQSHLQAINQCMKVQNVYSQQIQYLDKFYASLIQIVLHYKKQHIEGLKNQSIFLAQQFEKQISYLSETVNDVDKLTNDIRTNMDNILQSENESDFLSCVNYYNQIGTVLQKKVNSIKQQTKLLPNYTLSQLQQTISELDSRIQNLISSRISRAKSLYTCIKPINLRLKQSHIRKNSQLSKRTQETNHHQRSYTNIYEKQNNNYKGNKRLAYPKNSYEEIFSTTKLQKKTKTGDNEKNTKSIKINMNDNS